MKSKTWMRVGRLSVIAFLVLSLQMAAQTITTFDAPGAGTGPFQGTVPEQNLQSGDIVGYYIDANNVNHGFLRSRKGTFTTFDAPGAGTGPGQGHSCLRHRSERRDYGILHRREQ